MFSTGKSNLPQQGMVQHRTSGELTMRKHAVMVDADIEILNCECAKEQTETGRNDSCLRGPVLPALLCKAEAPRVTQSGQVFERNRAEGWASTIRSNSHHLFSTCALGEIYKPKKT